MQCPKCDNTPLKRGTLSAKKLTLDQCTQCKGMWFDKGELCTLLGGQAQQNFSIPKFAAKIPNTHCPCCNVSLYEFCYPGTMTLVDGCKQCEGVWLDNREWKAINQARDENRKISCPQCHTRQHPAESCNSCGIIIAKYKAPPIADAQDGKAKNPKSNKQRADSESSYADNIPGLKGSLLRNIDLAIRGLTESLF